MNSPQVKRVLKEDALGRVELLEGARGPLVRRVACGGRIPGSRGVARALMARERRALERLAGLVGVAELVEAPEYLAAPGLDGDVPSPKSCLLRSWLAGVPLYAAEELPEDFFELVRDLVLAMHARGVCHNDLHKEPNVLVGPGGLPGLVDYQLASVHLRGGRRFQSRVREDLRHVEKHRRRYLRMSGRAGAPERSEPRRSFVAEAWMRLGKPPYNFVTRKLLRTSDGEPRRPVEGPWPRWVAPVGGRAVDS